MRNELIKQLEKEGIYLMLDYCPVCQEFKPFPLLSINLYGEILILCEECFHKLLQIFDIEFEE